MPKLTQTGASMLRVVQGSGDLDRLRIHLGCARHIASLIQHYPLDRQRWPDQLLVPQHSGVVQSASSGVEALCGNLHQVERRYRHQAVKQFYARVGFGNAFKFLECNGLKSTEDALDGLAS